MNDLDRNTLIKTEMVINDLTQEKLAELMHLSKMSVNLKLQNKRDWSIKEIEKLAEIFGKERNYFF